MRARRGRRHERHAGSGPGSGDRTGEPWLWIQLWFAMLLMVLKASIDRPGAFSKVTCLVAF